MNAKNGQADRLLDGFRWEKKDWQSSGPYSGTTEDGIPTLFNLRYFRADWRDGAVFVSPSFAAKQAKPTQVCGDAVCFAYIHAGD